MIGWRGYLTGGVALVLAGTALAAGQQGGPAPASVEARLQRIERLLGSQGLVDMLTRLDQLQQDVQTLRGQLEVQGHRLEQLQKRQRDLYIDLDRRLQALESRGTVAAAPAPGAGRAPAAPAGAGARAPGQATATATTAATADEAEARKAYEAALQMLRDGRYDDAAAAYQAFLKRFPGSSYADNAQYWLGETRYVTRQFAAAQAAFGKVVSQFPDSPKRPDAELKLGFIQYELGHWDKARAQLQAVVSRYPDSTAARLAKERLARMEKEGH